MEKQEATDSTEQDGMPVVLRESGVEELAAFPSQLKTVIKKAQPTNVLSRSNRQVQHPRTPPSTLHPPCLSIALPVSSKNFTFARYWFRLLLF